MEKVIENTRHNFFKQKFVNELEYLNNISENDVQFNILHINTPYDIIKNRIHQLQNILESFTVDKYHKKTLDDMFEEIDNYIYKKQWKKLKSFHQIAKLKEYIKSKYKKEKQNEILKILINAAKNNKLNKKGMIKYNSTKAIIISIPCLQYDKKTEKYFIKM